MIVKRKTINPKEEGGSLNNVRMITKQGLLTSVADPVHVDTDPDPGIRFVEKLILIRHTEKILLLSFQNMIF